MTTTLVVEGSAALYAATPPLEAAARLGVEPGRPVCDCLHLALARELGTQLVAADGRFVTPLAASGRAEPASLARPLV